MNKLVYEASSGWSAEWHGGAYVDLYFAGQCVDIVNVYDYRAGEVVIPFTLDALKIEVDKHMEETEEDRANFEREALYRATR